MFNAGAKPLFKNYKTLFLQTNLQTRSHLSESEVFGILQNDRRLHFLELLYKNGNQNLRSISEAIARIESGASNPESSLRKSIYVSLLQNHLPKMEKLGLVNYNREKDIIELLPPAQDLKAYLGKDLEVHEIALKKLETAWLLQYLGLGILAMAGNLAILTGLVTFISADQWVGFISLVFFISGATQLLRVETLNLENYFDRARRVPEFILGFICIRSFISCIARALRLKTLNFENRFHFCKNAQISPFPGHL